MKESGLKFIIIFGVLSLLVNFGYGQSYNLGNTNNNYTWFKLGNLGLPQGGADAEMRIISGNGFNASRTQQGEAVIRFRTSNGSSQDNGFFGSGSFYNTGRTKIVSNVRIIQVSQSSWDIYAVLPSYTGYGSVLNLTSIQGTWTTSFVQATPPENLVGSTLKEESVIQSDTYFYANVGIGTLSPQEKLSVNGKIRAQEVKVESQNWPDYVFKKEYLLPSLSEIENYIQKNGHLSEVPSALEVEKNGIALGEMNKILLKKIEELTIYLIEKDKVDADKEIKLNRQQLQIDNLQNQMKQLINTYKTKKH